MKEYVEFKIQSDLRHAYTWGSEQGSENNQGKNNKSQSLKKEEKLFSDTENDFTFGCDEWGNNQM